MEAKLASVLNEMSEYLSISQMRKLQEVMLRNFISNSNYKKEISNDSYLQMFLDAKTIEGCSERTIKFYKSTIEKMLGTVIVPVRKISTEDIRGYLSDYQKVNNCSKVTVDNVRRNISSFCSVRNQ